MACKEFARNNPNKKISTLYYNCNRKSKDLMAHIGFVSGLFHSAKPTTIEDEIKKDNSDVMFVAIVDEADALCADDRFKSLFEWAQSPDHNFAMIVMSTSPFDEQSMPSITQEPKLVFP